MSYPNISRVINSIDLQKDAMIRIREKGLIDRNQYNILSSGIFENAVIDEEGNKADIIQVVVCDTNCNEKKLVFQLTKDLNLSPDTIFNYYLYRFDIKTLKRGVAIRIIKEPTETDKDWFAYNAILVDRNVRQISYVMVPSRGPFHRILTARQAYTHGVKVYVYQAPDIIVNTDNIDNGCHCDEIK